jgi:hypothetical protein
MRNYAQKAYTLLIVVVVIGSIEYQLKFALGILCLVATTTAGYRDMSGTFGFCVAGDRGDICAQATIPGVVN